MEERKKRRKLNIKLPSFGRGRYVFTDKKHPEKGVLSAALGLISVATIVYAVILSYRNGGQAEAKYAVAVMFCLVYSIAGLVLGIMSRMERDIFKLFPNLGIILNVLALIWVGLLLYFSVL
ncbi:DUF6142 family protein [Butyrivibrio sp. INlla16]|uniref:DUF6142 family protein n=1 Tax=Butyrivibrio sp. INlla16 TaxID=1520807 RepID=UPI00088D3365|nr:DUF6142 family protein [Butyrivibrio sp. INlla16]SDB40738.1 hypothetical protein SAMN02910263_01956 [Butyrivibrio sp. INlla16]